MSQTAIATKKATSAITGTAGSTYNVAGRDNQGILSWRGVLDASVIASDKVLSQTGTAINVRGQVAGFKSTTILTIPSMKTIADSSTSSGYVAAPEVAAYSRYKLLADRSLLLNDDDALTALRELGFMLCSSDSDSVKFQRAIIGLTPADA